MVFTKHLAKCAVVALALLLPMAFIVELARAGCCFKECPKDVLCGFFPITYCTEYAYAGPCGAVVEAVFNEGPFECKGSSGSNTNCDYVLDEGDNIAFAICYVTARCEFDAQVSPPCQVDVTTEMGFYAPMYKTTECPPP